MGGPGHRRKVSREYKSQILDEFVNSNLTIDEICKKHDLRPTTFRWWCSLDKSLRELAFARAQLTSKKPRYTFEQRKTAVEAFLKSGMTYTAFAKVYGVSTMSISVWTRIYLDTGPQGLSSAQINKFRGRKPIPDQLKKQIVEVKQENPKFGMRKIRDFLKRFRGLNVSHKTVGKTLKENDIPMLVVSRKKKRSSDKIRRFERAKPMQLWQSDITSYVLTRHSQRVYLTVFLDDHSRYVVAWNLQLRQTNDLVIDALLNGVQKFGKPEEVLTDQGRQYFAWRGRSDFRKLLDKEGISHVVARSHHPQTLGKCERLWETVKNELWDRARPQELTEARERLRHFFNHYNHFRPHQGLDGMTPADRFFGLENEIRKRLEESMKDNSLRMAVGELPRPPVFLVGQIGERRFSLHGEEGHLVLNIPEGDSRSTNYKTIGTQQNGDENGSGAAETEIERSQTGFVQTSPYASDTNQRPLGDGDIGRKAKSTDGRHKFVGVLDGANHETGNGNGDRSASGEDLAVVAASNFGNVGGLVEAAKKHAEGSDFDRARESQDPKKENSRIGTEDRNAGSPHRDIARNAGLQEYSDSNGSTNNDSRSEETWPSKEKPATDGSSS